MAHPSSGPQPLEEAGNAGPKSVHDPAEEPAALASELPEPESIPGWGELPPPPQNNEPRYKGIVTAVTAAIKKTPLCIYVVNLHSESIWVVVSRHRPSRMLSGIGVDASTTGGGLNFTTATYTLPASQKQLAPATEGPDRSRATFPLYNRSDSFGVITIYKGRDKELFIVDRVPMGATVFFENNPDLKVVKFQR